MNNFEFPKQIFPDIDANHFNKHQKKNISEDFVAENLEYAGWNVYTPFVDTGMDLVATKKINGRHVTRFIQVKTRALTHENIFGYTLKPKDFRDDPRHVFLLYSDSTMDFFILPMYEYLKFFMDHKAAGSSHFSAKSFRVENNKINSLRYFPDEDVFKFSGKSFEAYRNKKGLELMENTEIEDNFYEIIEKNREMKINLFYRYHDVWLKTKINKSDNEKTSELKTQIKNSVTNSFEEIIEESNEQRKHKFHQIEDDFREKYPELYQSHKRYVL